MAPLTPLNDLDQLLADSLAESDDAKREFDEINAARKRLRRLRTGAFGSTNADESLALRTAIARFEEKHNWTSTSLVLLVQRQNCSCGSTHEFAQGEFLRQSHLRDKASRLIPNNWPNCGLPRSIEYHDSSTHLCVSCAEGWLK